ncbi:MAG: MFS transporter [Fibrobacteres bacterium]|nr:MFS transporter [Fibrobacterota bacterium]
MKNPNRNIILGFLLIIQMMIGGHYAWSLFSRELITKFGFTTTMSQVTYSVYHLMFALAFLFGGRILESKGPRFTALTGGVIFGTGYLLAGIIPISVVSLPICIGILGGIGSGFCYITPIATAQKWFEDKKSVATGIIVGFFAFGSVLISFSSELMLNRGVSLPDVFKILGSVYFTFIVIASLFLKNPNNYKSNSEQLPFSTLVKDKTFWSMAVPMFAGLFVGLMVIGSLKNIGISKDIKLAGFAVMFISAFNGAGRLFWGWIIHKIGEEKSIVISLSAQSLVLFTSVYWVSGYFLFFLFAGLVGLLYGCTLVVYASNISRIYGVRHLSNIYGYMFLTNAAAGITAPLFAGMVKDRTGSYDIAIMITGVICLVSLVFYLFLRKNPASST